MGTQVYATRQSLIEMGYKKFGKNLNNLISSSFLDGFLLYLSFFLKTNIFDFITCFLIKFNTMSIISLPTYGCVSNRNENLHSLI